MNPFCFICQEPITRVCVHPHCHQKMPFLCGGDCKLNTATSLHTHDGQTQLIPYDQVLQKIMAVTSGWDENKHLQTVRKRVAIIKDSLDYMLEKYQADLGIFQQNVCKETQLFMDQFQDSTSFDKILGEQISEFMQRSVVYEDQKEMEDARTNIKDCVEAKLETMEIATSKLSWRTELWKLAEYHYRKGYNLEVHESRCADALEQYQTANRYNPGHPETLFVIGHCEKKLGHMELALQAYNQCISAGAQGDLLATTYNNIGIIHRGLHKEEQAIEYFTKAIKSHSSGYLLAFRNRGNSHCELGHFKEAVSDYSFAIHINPNQMELLVSRAHAYRQLRMEVEAMADERKVKELEENLAEESSRNSKVEEELPKTKGLFSKLTDIFRR